MAGAVVAALLLSVCDVAQRPAEAQQPAESFRDCPDCPEMMMLPAHVANLLLSACAFAQQPVEGQQPAENFLALLAACAAVQQAIKEQQLVGVPQVDEDQQPVEEPQAVKGQQSAEAPQAVKEQQPVEEPEPQPGDSFRDCPHCPEMVMLPAGEFMMGSPRGVGSDVERPRHEVTIPHPFAVGKYEVTNEEYAAFLSANPGFPDLGTHGDDRHPVIEVSWHDAKAYVAWLSRETGHEYRLLSESEWEYAARAGTQGAYYWGDGLNANAHCAFCGTSWDGELSIPVGNFFANGFGLHDMHGNVWEWVEDCWNGSYAGAPSDGSAWLRGDCERRVLRGGSWKNRPEILRAAIRGRYAAGNRYAHLGFRVARTN